MNAAENGIALPLPRHYTQHRRYNKAVRRVLDELFEHNRNISEARAAELVRGYADQLRAGFKRSTRTKRLM